MAIKVLDLFCGAGSFSLNMTSNHIEHEIVGFSDIRESAIKLFCKLHNKSENENLGDIKSVNAKDLKVDLLVFGSPCQSFTRAGKSEGGLKGSNTKSSLMWEAVRIMDECKPKWIVWENVPDAINKSHFKNFQNYIEELDEMGYNTYYEVLNAHDLGAAQKRKRLFSVSIRKDIDNGEFKFVYEKTTPKHLKEYLDFVDSEAFLVEPKISNSLILGQENGQLKIKNATKLGYLLAAEGDAVDTGFYNSTTRRGRVQKGSCQTLLRSKGIATVQGGKLRYLTPFEYWKLQEMPIELYQKVEECDFSLNEYYDVVGGVINQKHLDVVFKSLSECFNWNKV